MGGAHVHLNQTENDDHTMRGVTVDIYVDRDTAEVCTDDAPSFALAVLRAVEEARDWNAFVLGRDYERGQK